jgi:hypothetical protein
MAMQLDGELTERVWNQAPAITDFVQRDPTEGAKPTFSTRARVVYDRIALYVAVEAFDSEPSKIAGLLTRRDTDSPSDWIRIAIDSYHDRRSAYEFAVNPAGVKQDRYWSTTAARTPAGTPCGMWPSGRTRRAGEPSSAFRFRSCAFTGTEPQRLASQSHGRSGG